MFKIDFMSSLKENQINGFDLAIMEQIEMEEKNQIQEQENEILKIEKDTDQIEEEKEEDFLEYEDPTYLD